MGIVGAQLHFAAIGAAATAYHSQLCRVAVSRYIGVIRRHTAEPGVRRVKTTPLLSRKTFSLSCHVPDTLGK